ncbi:hypothetical protein RD792_004076 [Penstemon davidsonii]|uniref:Uncharacterized protein n=1 Tax=Penstemon davidsonii TaxID=160366 RepID=A0ABR0DH84_9LAMI|nr:hypothetical protein RD792_004076 [Penstemon davidsonii]
MVGRDIEKMVAVGLVWGATNAFMRKGALIWDKALKSTPQTNTPQLKKWLKLLVIWQYTLPFLINLSASATFFAILSDTPISLAVPVTNATTFAATAVFGTILGEETRSGLALLVEEPSKRPAHRLFKNLIGDDGRVYACAERTFFAFENNGSIAWTVQLNYMCNPNIAPVHGGSRKARVLKIHPLKIGTSEPAVEVFFGPGEIIGLFVSIPSSCVLISVQNRGLFAYRLHGQLQWSAGPVLYQHGYRQGCRENITDCYFTSVPVIDHCESSIYISNNLGELYSLSVRGPYFKWIQDLSSFGKTFTVTPGNNGRVYVTIQNNALVLALDVSTGNILWQGSFGPLSSSDYEPVIDANGWLSVGSLDGYLYSFSPTGDFKKFPRSASLSSVIQVNPILDCSGYAVYISQTEMEGKNSQIIGEYTYISAMKPRNVVFTLLNPASGSVYWSENDPSKFMLNLSQSDLKHFLLDERTVLAFAVVSSKFFSFSIMFIRPCTDITLII